MLQKTQPTTPNRSLIQFSDPDFHRTVASNVMTIVFLLKMTGVLVTRCARLHHSPVFLVEVAHGVRLLSRQNLKDLAIVLGVPEKMLRTTSETRNARYEHVNQFLQQQGRLSHEGLPVHNEDELLMGRFPEIVQELNEEYSNLKEDEDESDWYD